MTIREQPMHGVCQTRTRLRLLNQETSKAKNDLEFLPPPPCAETTGVYHVYSFRGTRAPSQGFIYAMQVLSLLNYIPDPI